MLISAFLNREQHTGDIFSNPFLQSSSNIPDVGLVSLEIMELVFAISKLLLFTMFLDWSTSLSRLSKINSSSSKCINASKSGPGGSRETFLGSSSKTVFCICSIESPEAAESQMEWLDSTLLLLISLSWLRISFWSIDAIELGLKLKWNNEMSLIFENCHSALRVSPFH